MARFANGLGYARDDARLQGLWSASLAAGTDETAIAQIARCSAADAFRLSVLRRSASPVLVDLWLSGALSVRQMGRICLLDCPLLEPHTEEEQIELARVYPQAHRRLKTPGEGR